MKNSLFIILLVVVIGSAISILYKKRNVNDTPQMTEAYFTKKLIDVGDRPLKSTVQGEFVIHNKGKNNLIIKSVTPDCHCTVSAFSKKPIKPNDSTKITLKYDSTMPGVFQSSAMVATNSTTQGTTVLILRGNVTP